MMSLSTQSRLGICLNREFSRKSSSFRRKEYSAQVIDVRGELLCGFYPVQLALQARNRDFYTIYHSPRSKRLDPILEAAHQLDIQMSPLSRNELDQLVYRKEKMNIVHQGICADVSKLRLKEVANSTEKLKPQFWVLPLALKDPMNLGAILRTSYFLGVDKVVLPFGNFDVGPSDSKELYDFSCSKPTPVVSKASSGVLEVFPPEAIFSSVSEFLQGKREEGWHTVCGSPSLRNTCSSFNTVANANIMLVLGGEGLGIPAHIENVCDSRLHIRAGRELTAGIDSLNVSVAAALLINQIQTMRINI